jgi:multidrug efflux pump
LPNGLTGEIVYDSTDFINTSITRGRENAGRGAADRHGRDLSVPRQFRAVIVPVIAMPLSLIGTFFVMLALGYSINLLTLLALVLAIGWWSTMQSSWSRTSTGT